MLKIVKKLLKLSENAGEMEGRRGEKVAVERAPIS